MPEFTKTVSIVGPPGTGKTEVVKHWTRQWIAAGGSAFIVDRERQFGDIAVPFKGVANAAANMANGRAVHWVPEMEINGQDVPMSVHRERLELLIKAWWTSNLLWVIDEAHHFYPNVPSDRTKYLRLNNLLTRGRGYGNTVVLAYQYYTQIDKDVVRGSKPAIAMAGLEGPDVAELKRHYVVEPNEYLPEYHSWDLKTGDTFDPVPTPKVVEKRGSA